MNGIDLPISGFVTGILMPNDCTAGKYKANQVRPPITVYIHAKIQAGVAVFGRGKCLGRGQLVPHPAGRGKPEGTGYNIWLPIKVHISHGNSFGNKITREHMLCKTRLCHHPSRSEEHTSELQSLMRISYAVFCLI